MHQATVDILRTERYSLSDWQTEKRKKDPVLGDGVETTRGARTGGGNCIFLLLPMEKIY